MDLKNKVVAAKFATTSLSLVVYHVCKICTYQDSWCIKHKSTKLFEEYTNAA